MQEQDADPQTPQPASFATGPDAPPEPDAAPLDLAGIRARYAAAVADTSSAGLACADSAADVPALVAAVEEARGHLERWANSPDDLRENISRALAALS